MELRIAFQDQENTFCRLFIVKTTQSVRFAMIGKDSLLSCFCFTCR